MTYPDAVVITGAGRGLGKEVALNLAKEGIFVLCVSKTNNCYVTADKINKTGGRAQAIQIDISNWYYAFSSIYAWCQNYKDYKIGTILNASVLGEKGGILNSRVDDWDLTMKTNLLGNVAVLQGVFPNITSNNYGRIVWIAGGGAANARPLFTGYSLSKTAIVREVENIAEELKDNKNFSIIALAPGAIKTDMLEEAISAGEEIKETIGINEPVNFINNFMKMDNDKANSLSGKYIHVKDNLESEDFENKWLLRRIEK